MVGSKRKLSNSLGRVAERGKRSRLIGEDREEGDGAGGGGRGRECGGEVGLGGREGVEEGGSGKREGGAKVTGVMGSVDHLLLAAGIEVKLTPCSRKFRGNNLSQILLFCELCTIFQFL